MKTPFRFSCACLLAIGVGASVVGCASDNAEPPNSDWRAEIDTVGDTVRVRTLSGSIWGTTELQQDQRIGAVDGADHEIFGDISAIAVDDAGNIYVYDRQVPALRKYTANGDYVITLGREGGGPGEYAQPDGGLAVLADGRVVLRDPGNVRLTVYGNDGAYQESWPQRDGRNSSTPLFAMPDGGFVNPVFAPGQPTRLVRYAADGEPLDTLPLPERDVERAFLRAEVEGGGARITYGVPFTPSAQWTWHPEGYFLSAVSDRYAIDLLRSDTVIQLGRVLEPVPISEAERTAQETHITQIMRNFDPAWRWSGPAIPSTKPLIRDLFTGKDGQIWVQLHQSGERTATDESEGDVAEPDQVEFRERAVFDVFDTDGRYLGLVTTPPTFSVDPPPTFRDEYVWATERDELGVQYVVRYRLAHSTR
jgi:hypothetical protein